MSEADAQQREWIAELDRADRQIIALVHTLAEIRDNPDATATIRHAADTAIRRRFQTEETDR